MKELVITFIILILSVKCFCQIEQKDLLDIGAQPPHLAVIKWLNGTPIKQFEKGHVYVIEFTATWCPPCRKAIPHLSKLAKKYQGKIDIISIYTMEENSKNIPSDLSYIKNVETLLEAMKAKINYTVAVDTPSNRCAELWLKANGSTGIPKVFVIDQTGHIVWIGQPWDLDQIIALTLAKEINPELEKHKQQQFRKVLHDISAKSEGSESSNALISIDSLIKSYPEREHLYSLKFKILCQIDEYKAYTLLQWMLNNLQDFDWLHMVHDTWASQKQPNYKLALEVANRAIEESETKFIEAYGWYCKADIYIKIQDYNNALVSYQHALECSKTSANPRDPIFFQEKLNSFSKLYKSELSKQGQ